MPITSGMTGMLKALGLDPDELKKNVETFMETMTAAAQQIKANQIAIETKLTAIEGQLKRIQAELPEAGTTTSIKNDDGNDTGILVTTEKFPDELIRDVGLTTT